MILKIREALEGYVSTLCRGWYPALRDKSTNIKIGEGKTCYLGAFWRSSPFLVNLKIYIAIKMYTGAKVAKFRQIYWQ